MNGHLLRCRLRIRSSRTAQYAPVWCSPAPCIWPFLNRLP